MELIIIIILTILTLPKVEPFWTVQTKIDFTETIKLLEAFDVINLKIYINDTLDQIKNEDDNITPDAEIGNIYQQALDIINTNYKTQHNLRDIRKNINKNIKTIGDIRNEVYEKHNYTIIPITGINHVIREKFNISFNVMPKYFNSLKITKKKHNYILYHIYK